MGDLADLGATLADIPTLTPTVREVSGTTATVVITDAYGCIVFTGSSPVAVTLPHTDTLGSFPVNGTVTLVQQGSGAVTVNAGVGVTLVPHADYDDPPTTNGIESYVTLHYRGSNRWGVVGQLVAAA